MSRAARIEEAARNVLAAWKVGSLTRHERDELEAALALPDDDGDAALREVAELRAERQRDALDGQAALDEANNEIVRLRARLEDALVCADYVLNWGVRVPQREAAKRVKAAFAHPAPASATACPECGGTGLVQFPPQGTSLTGYATDCPACRGGRG